jgi:hypothetical protein
MRAVQEQELYFHQEQEENSRQVILQEVLPVLQDSHASQRNEVKLKWAAGQ